LKFEEVNYAVNTILGYTPEEIKGSPVLFYLDTEDRPHVQKLCKDNKEQFSFETGHTVKKGLSNGSTGILSIRTA